MPKSRFTQVSLSDTPVTRRPSTLSLHAVLLSLRQSRGKKGVFYRLTTIVLACILMLSINYLRLIVNFYIQRATPHTVGEVAALFNDYRVFYDQASDVKLAQEFISERLINNESVIFYAKDTAGNALGFTQLYPSFSSVSAKRLWVLNDLFVSPRARGCGIARQLMNAAKDFAISTGAKGINLETTADNQNAQALYESLGYEKINGFYFYHLTI